MIKVTDLIRIAKYKGASDLHLSAGSPAMLRIHGSLTPAMDETPLTADEMKEALNQITTEAERAEFYKNLELDFAYTIPDVVRVRCNAAMQRGTVSLVMRLVANSIPDIDTLHIPELCKELILRPRGMLMISGPTGSGKSTTLAAMIEYLNQHENRRIVTIEDPIEYV